MERGHHDAPTDSNSTSFINFIGGGTGLHPDFGGNDGTPFGTYGMIYAVVPGAQPLEIVDFSTGYPTQSDTGAPGRPRVIRSRWGHALSRDGSREDSREAARAATAT